MIYLDSAAVVKLVHAEPESAALRCWLDERAETGWVSSVLTEIESFRALARYAPEAASRLPAVLDQIDLIDLDQRIRVLARTVTPATVRSLDAFHLGTALCSRPSSRSSLIRPDTTSPDEPILRCTETGSGRIRGVSGCSKASSRITTGQGDAST